LDDFCVRHQVTSEDVFNEVSVWLSFTHTHSLISHTLSLSLTCRSLFFFVPLRCGSTLHRWCDVVVVVVVDTCVFDLFSFRAYNASIYINITVQPIEKFIYIYIYFFFFLKVQDVVKVGDLDDEFLPAILRVAEYSYFMEQVTLHCTQFNTHIFIYVCIYVKGISLIISILVLLCFVVMNVTSLLTLSLLLYIFFLLLLKIIQSFSVNQLIHPTYNRYMYLLDGVDS
jgi:hypothetical protein